MKREKYSLDVISENVKKKTNFFYFLK